MGKIVAKQSPLIKGDLPDYREPKFFNGYIIVVAAFFIEVFRDISTSYQLGFLALITAGVIATLLTVIIKTKRYEYALKIV